MDQLHLDIETALPQVLEVVRRAFPTDDEYESVAALAIATIAHESKNMLQEDWIKHAISTAMFACRKYCHNELRRQRLLQACARDMIKNRETYHFDVEEQIDRVSDEWLREVLRLRIMRQFTLQELSKTLGVSESRIQRLMTHVKNLIREPEE